MSHSVPWEALRRPLSCGGLSSLAVQFHPRSTLHVYKAPISFSSLGQAGLGTWVLCLLVLPASWLTAVSLPALCLPASYTETPRIWVTSSQDPWLTAAAKTLSWVRCLFRLQTARLCHPVTFVHVQQVGTTSHSRLLREFAI